MTMGKNINKVSKEITTMSEGVAESQMWDNCKHPALVTTRVL